MILRRIAAAVLLAVSTTTEAPARTWTSATGTFQVEAELIEKGTDGTVVLKRKDGVTLKTKLEKLSKVDQEYVRQWKPSGDEKHGDDLFGGEAPDVADGVVSPEEKSAFGKIKSVSAQSAIQAYEKREKELKETYTAKQKEYGQKLAGLLEEALKEATAAGDLDDALVLRNAIVALRRGEQPPADADLNPPSGSSHDEPPDTKKKPPEYPRGTWTITYSNGATRTYRFSGRTALWLDNRSIRGRLYYQGNNLLLEFGDGKIERLTLEPEGLVVEHWNSKGSSVRPAEITGTGNLIKK